MQSPSLTDPKAPYISKPCTSTTPLLNVGDTTLGITNPSFWFCLAASGREYTSPAGVRLVGPSGRFSWQTMYHACQTAGKYPKNTNKMLSKKWG